MSRLRPLSTQGHLHIDDGGAPILMMEGCQACTPILMKGHPTIDAGAPPHRRWRNTPIHHGGVSRLQPPSMKTSSMFGCLACTPPLTMRAPTCQSWMGVTTAPPNQRSGQIPIGDGGTPHQQWEWCHTCTPHRRWRGVKACDPCSMMGTAPRRQWSSVRPVTSIKEEATPIQ